MWLFIREEETTESFSQSLTSFKSPQDRRGENDKAEFELSPPSRREIIAKHFLLQSLSATQKTQKNSIYRKETSVPSSAIS